MTVSFAVTAYEETVKFGPSGILKILECITPAIFHPGIDEVVVVDDHSTDAVELFEVLTGMNKVKVHGNSENLGVFGNKVESIASCTSDWVICCDSDNRMDHKFIDKAISNMWSEKYWHCPSFAKPKFDYRPFIGQYNSANIAELVQAPGLSGCLLNTGNQTVNRKAFMEVFGKYRGCRADLMMPNWLGLPEEERRKIHNRIVFDACDSLILNMEWIKSGGVMNVAEGMEYEHYWTGGDESHYNRAPKEKHQLNEILLKELSQ